MMGHDKKTSLTAEEFLHIATALESSTTISDLLIGASEKVGVTYSCLLYTSPSPRDKRQSRMPSSA